MRVSISATGSLMLIQHSPARLAALDSGRSPAGLDDARNVALEGEIADLAAPQAEHAECAARSAGQLAAVAQPRRIGVARQLLQLLALDVGLLGHGRVLQFLNGKRKALSSALHSSSVFALVVMLMFNPRIASILS